MKPLISVLIDTYNHERYIEQAILSAIEQDFPSVDYEILVVDDGSTDRTPEIVRKFEPRVRLLRKPNGGQASAINLGTSQAKGVLVAFLDGDDLWLPGKLSCVAKEFGKNPEAAMIYHKFRFWDDRRDMIWEGWFAGLSGDIVSDREKLLAYNPPPTSSLVFRREALKRLMPVPNPLTFMADMYLFGAIVFLGPVAAVPEVLAINRVHGENLWFTDDFQPDPDVLRRRLRLSKAATQALRGWVRRTGNRSWRSKARLLLRVWRVVQDQERFRLRTPGRFRYFSYRCRLNLLHSPTMTSAHRAYDWAHAFFELVVGREHSHYLEGIRTRVKRLGVYLGGRFRPSPQGD